MNVTYQELEAAQDRHDITCPRCLRHGNTASCATARWLERRLTQDTAQKEAA